MTSSSEPTKLNIDSFLQAVSLVLSPAYNTENSTLADLWNSLEKDSAYGVAVPLFLPKGEPLVHHYAPYLSALQIFTKNSSANSKSGEKKGVISPSSESISDSSNGSTEKPWEGPSSSEGVRDYRNLKPSNQGLGSRYLHFCAYGAPFERLTFKEQIDDLAKSYPGLMSFKRGDLSPASWMAIAWYPIYSIPQGQKKKDMETCFLTYYALSYSAQGVDLGKSCKEGSKDGSESNGELNHTEGEDLRLTPFGLVAHRMNGDLWLKGLKVEDIQRLNMMWGKADYWLHQLNFYHNDYDYILRHRRNQF